MSTELWNKYHEEVKEQRHWIRKKAPMPCPASFSKVQAMDELVRRLELARTLGEQGAILKAAISLYEALSNVPLDPYTASCLAAFEAVLSGMGMDMLRRERAPRQKEEPMRAKAEEPATESTPAYMRYESLCRIINSYWCGIDICRCGCCINCNCNRSCIAQSR